MKLSFFVTHGCGLALPASHRTRPKIFTSKFLGSCRACCQVFHLHTLCVSPVWLLSVVLISVGGLEQRGYFYTLFHSCLFIVSRACHVCRWSCASANQLPFYRLARARVRAAGLSFWRGGGRCALSISKHNAPLLLLALHFPGNRLLGARIAALGEMSVEIILYFRGKV